MEFNFIFRNLKAAEAEEAKRLAEEKAAEARKKGEEARHLEEELLIAQQGLEESQRKLADVTFGSNSSININHHHHRSNIVTSRSKFQLILSNEHIQKDSKFENKIASLKYIDSEDEDESFS